MESFWSATSTGDLTSALQRVRTGARWRATPDLRARALSIADSTSPSDVYRVIDGALGVVLVSVTGDQWRGLSDEELGRVVRSQLDAELRRGAPGIQSRPSAFESLDSTGWHQELSVAAAYPSTAVDELAEVLRVATPGQAEILQTHVAIDAASWAQVASALDKSPATIRAQILKLKLNLKST